MSKRKTWSHIEHPDGMMQAAKKRVDHPHNEGVYERDADGNELTTVYQRSCYYLVAVVYGPAGKKWLQEQNEKDEADDKEALLRTLLKDRQEAKAQGEDRDTMIEQLQKEVSGKGEPEEPDSAGDG